MFSIWTRLKQKKVVQAVVEAEAAAALDCPLYLNISRANGRFVSLVCHKGHRVFVHSVRIIIP